MAQPLTTLRDARVAAGLSQQTLAERCGMGAMQISKLERGVLDVLNIRVGNLWAMAEALGVDPADIVGNRRKMIERDKTMALDRNSSNLAYNVGRMIALSISAATAAGVPTEKIEKNLERVRVNQREAALYALKKANESLAQMRSRDAETAAQLQNEMDSIADLLPAEIPAELDDPNGMIALGYGQQGAYDRNSAPYSAVLKRAMLRPVK